MTMEQTHPGHHFIYNGFNSSNYGVFISGVGTYDAPAREVETVSVPGRNGDILFDNKRFSNIDIVYPCYIPRGFVPKFEDFKAAMLSDTGYHRLEDTYNPEYYREAYVTGPIQPGTGALNRSGSFEVTFHCKPQRFLKEGERTVTLTASGSIHNRTLYPSKPLIQVIGAEDGAGQIEFVGTGLTGAENVYSVSFHDNPTGIFYLDCETQNAYYERIENNVVTKIPINHLLYGVSNGFPQIVGGYNTVRLVGNITRISIQPRWWTV